MWRALMMIAGFVMMAGCTDNRPERTLPPEDVSKPRILRRSMTDFLEKPDKKLTPAMAEARFGKPDAINRIADTRSFSYIYDLGFGLELELGFFGTDPQIYAVIRDPDGTVRELPMK